jgi:two-component system, cell cycle sensor histidine kinase and response regulator CckA
VTLDKRSLRKQNVYTVLFSLALIGCIIILLFLTYTSQQRIQDFALEQLRQDSEKRATAVSYFYSERRNDLSSLADQRALSTFFENQALGMSMQYGLSDSLFAMAQQLEKLIDEHRVRERKVFSRVLFLSSDGTILAQRSQQKPKSDDAVELSAALHGKGTDAEILLVADGNNTQVVATIPYFFKGASTGRIVAYIDTDAVYDYLLRTESGSSKRTLAVTGENGLLHYSVFGQTNGPIRVIERDFDSMVPRSIYRYTLPIQNGTGGEVIALKTPILDTPFFLLTVAPSEEILSVLASAQFLFLISTVCFLILGGVFMITRVNTRKFVLQARLDEAAKVQRVLEEKNELLEKEIRERLLVEESLRNSEARFSTFMSHLPAAVFIKDQDGRLLFANAYLKEVFGWQDCVGKTTIELLPRELADRMIADDTKALSRGLQVVTEIVHDACGAQRVFETHKFPIRMGQDVSFLGGISLDITERKLAEESLRESEEKYRSLFQSMNQGVFYQNADGELADANPSALRMFGLTLEDLLERTSASSQWDVIHEDGSPFPGEEHPSMMALRTGKPIKDVVAGVFNPQSESYVWMVINAFPQYHPGEASPYRVFVTMHDITDRRRSEEERMKLEQRLQQAQKEESLGRMAGGIAHHFNNMLGAVMGNLEMALIDLPQEREARTSIDQAMKASRQAAKVSQLMLDYLGLSTGRGEAIDLSVACREALLLLKASLPKKVNLRMEFPEQGVIIRANALQVKQVVTNLVVNAGESIGAEGGEVRIVVSVAPVDLIKASRFFPPDWKPKEEVYACLEVWDTGCGMDMGTLDKVFDPFFSTKFTGRGLGLPVVLGVVRAHEGVVLVGTKPGEGTTFRVLWPLLKHQLPQPAKSEQVAPLPIEGRRLVLLVEDEPLVRNMALQMLDRLGYAVTSAEDGVEALEVFRRQHKEIDCVLLDLTMPGMDGWETLSALRELRPDVPVILSSGYDEVQLMERLNREQPQAFLHKPYRMKDLEEALGLAQQGSKSSLVKEASCLPVETS